MINALDTPNNAIALSPNNALSQGKLELENRPIYPGLDPYSENDTDYFFGRDEDIEEIIRDLFAERLIILYGESGVGKSSVLRAGVAYTLDEKAEENLKDYQVRKIATVVFNNWSSQDDNHLQDNILGNFLQEIQEKMRETIGANGHLNADIILLLKSFVEKLDPKQQNGKVFIIFDQFEEYLLRTPNQQNRQFSDKFIEVFNNPDLSSVHFLISLRSDAITLIDDRFKGRLRGRDDDPLSHRIELKRLNRKSATEAIINPIKVFNEQQREKQQTEVEEPEEDFIKEVLDGVRNEDKFDDDGSTLIEVPLLQLVMTRLWEKEMMNTDPPSYKLQKQTYTELGGAKKIVREHLYKQIKALSDSDRETAACIFYYLITPGGSGVSHTVDDLLKYANDSRSIDEPELRTEQVELLLEKLIQPESRILRKVAGNRYEIFCSVLNEAVLHWVQCQRKLKYLKQEVQKARQQFGSSQLEALVTAMLVGQELKEIRKEDEMFLEYPSSPTMDLQIALQKILDNIREKNQFEHGEGPFYCIAFHPKKEFFATGSSDGTVHLWDFEGKQIREFKDHRGAVYQISFSRDGQWLATASRDGTACLRNLRDLKNQQDPVKFSHESSVYYISFSPDGKQLATASRDKTARLWDLQGKEKAKLEGHEDKVYRVEFSPDGNWLTTASADKTARLWDLQGNQIGSPLKHEDKVYYISFSPNKESRLLATASRDGTARLWDFSGNKKAEFKHQNAVLCVEFSGDGQQLATASRDGTVRLWDLDGNQIRQPLKHEGPVYRVKFSPDGQQLATASRDGTVHLWYLQKMDRQPDLLKEGHKDKVYRVEFSPDDGKWLATASEDETARLWKLNTGSSPKVVEGDKAKIYSVSFSPDEQLLATGASDGTIRLWDLKGHQMAEFKDDNKSNKSIQSISFSRNGQYLATGWEDGTVCLWESQDEGDKPQYVCKCSWEGHSGTVWSVNFSPDGKLLATASQDETACLWNLQGEEIASFTGHDGPVYCVTFSPDGNQLATASRDKTARLWSLQGKEKAKSEGHDGPVNWVSFNHDGNLLATASWDRTVRLWDLQGKQKCLLEGHESRVYYVSFIGDGQELISASWDGTIRRWDVRDLRLNTIPIIWLLLREINSMAGILFLRKFLKGQQLAKYPSLRERIRSVSISPKAEWLATAVWDGTLHLWDLGDKREKTLYDCRGHKGTVWDVSFSPKKYKEQCLATASEDGTARLWDLQGNLKHECKGHQRAVNSVCFNPCQELLATASWDKTVRLWDLQGKELDKLDHDYPVYWASFSHDGQYLATAAGNTAYLWTWQDKQQISFKEHPDRIEYISFSPDSKLIATICRNSTAYLWNVEDKKQFKEPPDTPGKSVLDISFHPNGKEFAFALADGTICRYDFHGKPLIPKVHTGSVWSVCYSPDGQLIATSSTDGTVCLWNLQGKQVAEFKDHKEPIWRVSFSPDGEYLATASDDGTAKLRQIKDLDWLLDTGLEWLKDYLDTHLDAKEDLAALWKALKE